MTLCYQKIPTTKKSTLTNHRRMARPSSGKRWIKSIKKALPNGRALISVEKGQLVHYFFSDRYIVGRSNFKDKYLIGLPCINPNLSSINVLLHGNHATANIKHF